MELKLPPQLVSRGDVNRILREIVKLDDYLVGADYKGEDQEAIRQTISPLLSELATVNQIDLLDQSKRLALRDVMDRISKQAPIFHISFSSAPSAKSIQQVLNWLRLNIHPQLLLTVGIQPSIAAGCVLRTSNRVFDMGLRQTLTKQQPLLLEMIKGVGHEAR